MTYPSSTPFLSFPFINNRRVALFSKQYSHSSFHLVREITISNLSNYFKTFELKKKKKERKRILRFSAVGFPTVDERKTIEKPGRKEKRRGTNGWKAAINLVSRWRWACCSTNRLGGGAGERGEERRGEREEKKKVSPTVTNKALHSSRSSC